MPTIKLLKRAEVELFEACDWYEEQQKGLSLKFRKEIRSTLDNVKGNQLIYAKRYDTELRFAIVHRFPFVIVFWFDATLNIIFVASIFNTNRNPDSLIK